MTDIVVRAITKDEFSTAQHTMGLSFGFDAIPANIEKHRSIWDLDRTHFAFDGERMVGTCGSLGLEMVVPGGALSVSGTSIVSVLPTHTRRGIMRAMMSDLLEDAQARQEPLSALWSSESSIYGRFGYGMAIPILEVRLPRAHARFLKPHECPSPTLRMVDKGEAFEAIAPIFERSYHRRTGAFARNEVWWRNKVLADLPYQRAGASSLRCVVLSSEGRDVGYALYRVKLDWSHSLPNNTLCVSEVFAETVEAEKALFEHLLNIDLVGEVFFWNLPVDHPLPWWLVDRRRARSEIKDGLWVRVMDVAQALSGRRYGMGGRLTLGVRDGLFEKNNRTFTLAVDGEGAGVCAPSTDTPDIELGVAALGSIFMGGVSTVMLAEAGLVSGQPGALRKADALFGHPPGPWCPEVF